MDLIIAEKSSGFLKVFEITMNLRMWFSKQNLTDSKKANPVGLMKIFVIVVYW